MADLILWGVGTSRTMRAHWMLHELGLDYESRPIQSRTGETFGEEFRRLNPRHKIPLLQHQSFVLSESAAIIQYLGETFWRPEAVYVPSDPGGRAALNEWCYFIMTELDAGSLYVMRRHEGLAQIYGEAPTAVASAKSYFRPGAADRVGLSEAAVREVQSDIVYVSISGFGENGPYAHQRAYDPVIQSLCGLAEIQRDRGTGRPRMIRTIIADYTTALTAAQAITAALFAKARTGQGQHVRIAMLDAMIAYLWPEAMPSLTFVGNEIDPSDSEPGPDLVFATQDRYITAAALSDDEWAGMCRSLKREDLIDDPRFKTARDRSINAVERREITAAELEKWTAGEILPRLLANDVPSAPILSRFELLEDPQVQQNQILEKHRSAEFGEVRQPRPAARFDRTSAAIRKLAPLLGADNEAILRELGYGADEIARLTDNRILYSQNLEKKS